MAITIPYLPFTDSSSTCSSTDSNTAPCVPAGAPDVAYVYRALADGCIRASLCGSSYDTEISVQDSTGQDSSGVVIACNDDFCGLSSEVNNVPVQANHTYFIIVDGFGGSCGQYNLLVDVCSPPPPPIVCPFDARPEGELTCADNYVDDYDGGCTASPDTYVDLDCSTDTIKVCGTYGTFHSGPGEVRDTDWYRITINNTTTLHYCVTGQYGTSIFLIDGRFGCGGATIIDGATANPGETACLNTTLGGGTYYLFAATSAFAGVPCGSNYYMTLVADSCPPPPLPPVCPETAIQEGEPVCHDDYVDNYDGGCNSFPATFVDLDCTPGTVEVCGTYGTYLYQGFEYRDTDWYRIVLNKPSNIEISATGQYATTLFLLDGRAGCQNLGGICIQSGSPSQPLTCNNYLPAGTYFVVVATSQFTDQPCGGIYVMSVRRDSCPAPFVLTCPADALPEGESACHDDYVDNYNAGCNSSPPTFTNPYAGGTGNGGCVPGPVRICGTYGTYFYQGFPYRDTDWYQIVVNNTTHLRFSAIGEAATSIFIVDGTAGCFGNAICGSQGARGDTIYCDANVGAGTYWLIVTTTDFFGIPCGSRYVASVTQDACPQPFHVQCPSGAKDEREPICSDLYVDATNGGCNSTPPVFGSVRYSPHRPAQFCGTYGTYRFQNIDYRDTDWYEFTLTEPRAVRFCVIGEARTSIHILSGGAGCPGVTYEASASGAPGDSICCEANLAAGKHWLFVTTTDFSGVPCGSQYVGTFGGDEYASQVLAVPRAAPPTGVAMIRAITPNPTLGNSRIDYALPHDAAMRLEVFDIAGHMVRVLVGQHLAPAGNASAFWDGRSDRGQKLSTGAYFVRLTVDERIVTHRLMLVR